MASANVKNVQTIGLNEGFVRMFKWIRKRIFDSDDGGQLEWFGSAKMFVFVN